jgi:hypothetical protein
VDGQKVILGKDQLTQRPQRRPNGDWRVIGKSFAMKENLAFCKSNNTTDLLKRMEYRSDLLLLAGLLDRERRDELTAQESKQLASIPLCEEFADDLRSLAEAVPYLSVPPANNSGRGLMISNTVISDEGHGWLVINNRLSNGDQAIIHTGHKMKEALNIFDGFIAKKEATVSADTAQQPFILKKFMKKSVSEDNGSTSRSRRCTTTVYRNHCEYDPQTGRGICREVPYTVEGWEEVTTAHTKETRVNDLEIWSSDDARVLAVLRLETTYDDSSISFGNCETLPIPDDDHHHWPVSP